MDGAQPSDLRSFAEAWGRTYTEDSEVPNDLGDRSRGA